MSISARTLQQTQSGRPTKVARSSQPSERSESALAGGKENLRAKLTFGIILSAFLAVSAILFQHTGRYSKNSSEIELLYGLLGNVERENSDLKLQLANFELLADETALLLRLEEEVMKVSAFKSNLGEKLPYVCYKVIQMVQRYRDEGLEMSLLLAMLEVESRFDPEATSTFVKDGKKYPLAYGLMQVIRSTARPYLEDLGYSWSPEIIFNVETNIEVGVAYLIDLHRHYMELGLEDMDDWHLSVTAYFWVERLTAEAMNGASKERTSVASLRYWKKVREKQMRWRAAGF